MTRLTGRSLVAALAAGTGGTALGAGRTSITTVSAIAASAGRIAVHAAASPCISAGSAGPTIAKRTAGTAIAPITAVDRIVVDVALTIAAGTAFTTGSAGLGSVGATLTIGT